MMKYKRKILPALLLAILLFIAVAFSASVSAEGAAMDYQTSGTATIQPENNGLRILASVPYYSTFKFVLEDDIALKVPIAFTLKSNIAVNDVVRNSREISFGLMELDELSPGQFNMSQVDKWWQEGLGSNGFTVSLAVMKDEQGQNLLKLCMYSRGTITNEFVHAPELAARIMAGESIYCEITRNESKARYDVAFYECLGGARCSVDLSSGEDFSVPFSRISSSGDFTRPPFFFLMADNYVDKLDGTPWQQDYIADVTFTDFSNGRIKTLYADDVLNISPDRPGKVNVTAVPYDTETDLSDITYTFTSSNDTVKVDSQGNLMTEADGGSATITVTSSEGDIATCLVTVEDIIPPELSVGEITGSFRTFETVILPLPEIRENSDDYTLTVTVLLPISIPCTRTETGYLFVPTVAGEYTVRYLVEDSGGNRAEKQVHFPVASDNFETYFSVINSKKGGITSIASSEDGRAFSIQGKIGDLTVNTGNESASMFAYSKLPIVITQNAPLEFDLTVAEYGRGQAGEILSSDDFARRIGIGLMQSEPDAAGNLKSADFKIGADGFGFWFGRNSQQSNEDANFRWELHGASKAGADSLIGARHINDVSAGLEYLPVYADAFDEVKMKETSAKINRGESIHVKIERRDDLQCYLFWLGDFPLTVPYVNVTRAGSDFVSPAYLYVGAISQSGEMYYDIRIDHLTNGNVKSLRFESEGSVDKKVGNSYTLIPEVEFYGENGELGDLVWMSSDPGIAMVEDGRVTLAGIGSALITAECSEGKIAYHYVDVEIDHLNVSKTQVTLFVGEDYKLQVASTPEGAPVSFYSDQPDIAAVLRDGTIQAVGQGTAVITISYLDCSVEVTVTVEAEKSTEKGCGGFASGTAIAGILLLVTTLVRKLR